MVRGRLVWPLEAEKMLLDWVEENKGLDGRLRESDDAVFDELLARYRDQFPGNDTFGSSVKQTNIVNKLSSMWRTFKKPQFNLAVATFYMEGPTALDWGKLSKRLEDHYTPQELQAMTNDSAPVSASDGITNGKRPLDTEGEDGREEVEENDASTSNESSTENPAKRQKLQHETSDDHEVQSLTDSQEGQSESEDEEVEFTTDLPVAPAPTTESRNEIEGQGREEHSDRPPNSREDLSAEFEQSAESASQLTTSLREIAIGKPYLSEEKLFGQIYRNPHPGLLKNFVSDGAPDDGTIDTTMTIIYDRLASPVNMYVERLGVKERQPILLDPELFYPEELKTLLTVVLGGNTQTVDGRRATFTRFQVHREVGYGELLHSLLAAAVMTWCLQFQTSEVSVFKDLGRGTVAKVFHHCLDPVVQVRLRQKLFAAHFEMNVLPHVRSNALAMAHKMQNYMDLLLPRLTTTDSYAQELKVISFPLTDPVSPVASSGALHPCEEAAERVELREKLTDIFQMALEFRAKMEMDGEESLIFSFPHSGDPYNAEQVKRAGPYTDYQTGTHVVLGLKPIVWRTHRVSLLHEVQRPWRAIHGVVICEVQPKPTNNSQSTIDSPEQAAHT